MFNKIFNQKRKRQEPGRHNTSKITMDPASTAILSRHFSPLSSRAKSPSDLLDIVGYPFITSKFTQSSPELILYSTPLQTNNNNQNNEEVDNNRQRLTIRNNTTPSPMESLSPDTNHDLLLLETSREDKTLIEEEKLDETKQEVCRLHQKLLEFEQERESWKQKLQGYIQREDQMRKIIQENQAQINQLKSMYNTPSRHNSYRTISTHSSSWPTDEEEDDDMEDDLEIQDNTDNNRDRYLYHYYTKDPLYYQQQQYNNGNLKRRYSSYYINNTTNNNNAYYQHHHHHRQPYYYYD